jgi:hypothetical protein
MFPRSISFPALALILLGLAGVARAAEFKGTWTIRPSDEAGQVYFGLAHHRDGGHSQNESDWDLGEFLGLDVATQARHDVKFSIARDAGRFECEGFIKEGEGAGIFAFTPNPAFAKEMAALGFNDIDDDKQFAMAVHDVSIAYAKEMKARNLERLDTDKLLAFRIFRITDAFIRDLRAEGLPADDAETLVAFKIHGVTPAMVHATRAAGLDPREDQLIAMRIHGATPEWIAQLAKDGYTQIGIDDMIAFRIHGVSPEFIEKVEAQGYKHPAPDDLVAMRIHGVTPEFIASLKSRGMKDLSIDKLVNLKIHGIE